MNVSHSDRRVQDCEPRRRLCFSVAKLGGSCIDFIRGVQQGRSESLARRHDENQGEADQACSNERTGLYVPTRLYLAPQNPLSFFLSASTLRRNCFSSISIS